MIAVCLLVAGAVWAADESPDLTLLRRRLLDDHLAHPPAAKTLRHLAASVRDDGSWPDIDYKNRQRGAWAPASHVRRIEQMVQGHKSPDSSLRGDPALGVAIHKALGYWLEHDLQCPNWWYNRIGVPWPMADILLMMGSDLTAAERKGVAKIAGRAGLGMTGQNKVWVSGITFTRAVALGDAALAAKAVRAVTEEVRVTTAEGIQPDSSFHQHGPQQQFGNYGAAFASDMVRWAALLAGTDHALSREQLTILRDYLLEGSRWVVWRGTMDISGCGRQLFPGAPAGKGRHILNALRRMAAVDSERAADYLAFAEFSGSGGAKGKPLLGNRHFWRSDMMVQRRPGFSASVKMSSARVIGAETCNSENMLGYHLGDGATYVYRDGREYEDIFPVWDWRRLPGVTCVQGWPKSLVPSTRRRNRGRFVGGASDGESGCAVMHYDRDGLTARKAWFFAGDAVVCLGTGIRTGEEREVTTAVNQCLLRGTVHASTGKAPETLAQGTREMRDVAWLHHDGIGYLFLAPARVTVRNAAQEGSWKRVRHVYADTPVRRDVFSVWISHGKRPQAGSYAYVMMPGASVKEMAATAPAPDVRVVANTPELQAVGFARLGVVQAVFHQPGRCQVAAGKSIAVDVPCVVVLAERKDGLRLAVADPAQTAKAVRVTVSWGGRDESVAVPLPRGGHAGQTVVRALGGKGG